MALAKIWEIAQARQDNVRCDAMELRGTAGDERGTTGQELTGLSITWPQATNGNLNNIKFGGTTIYNTPTGGGSLSTSSLLGTTAQRTINAGSSQTLQFSFQNNVDTNASHYTGSVTFNPFGNVTTLP